MLLTRVSNSVPSPVTVRSQGIEFKGYVLDAGFRMVRMGKGLECLPIVTTTFAPEWQCWEAVIEPHIFSIHSPHRHPPTRWLCSMWDLSSLKWSCSVVSDSVTPWTVAYQASLSMGFSRKEYWSVLPFPSPGALPLPGIEPGSPVL